MLNLARFIQVQRCVFISMKMKNFQKYHNKRRFRNGGKSECCVICVVVLVKLCVGSEGIVCSSSLERVLEILEIEDRFVCSVLMVKTGGTLVAIEVRAGVFEGVRNIELLFLIEVEFFGVYLYLLF